MPYLTQFIYIHRKCMRTCNQVLKHPCSHIHLTSMFTFTTLHLTWVQVDRDQTSGQIHTYIRWTSQNRDLHKITSKITMTFIENTWESQAEPSFASCTHCRTRRISFFASCAHCWAVKWYHRNILSALFPFTLAPYLHRNICFIAGHRKLNGNWPRLIWASSWSAFIHVGPQ